MGSNIKIANILVVCVFLLALAAMLSPKVILPSNIRSIYFLWESGHVVLFFLACHLFYICVPRFANLPFPQQTIILCGGIALGAIAIEGLQSGISGKDLEIRDIVNDITGVLLFLTSRVKGNRRKKIFIYLPACFLVAIALWPALCSFADEMVARYQFPLLADLETPFEAGRFETKTATATTSDQYVYHGKHSLKLVFNPGPWAGVRLEYFPRDWHGYTYLHFALYNPEQKALTVEVMIQDDLNGQPGNKQYNDLRGQNMSLPPGEWTTARIPFADIQNVLKTRYIDLTKITGVGFYLERQEQQLTLYLDAIRLE